MKYLFLIIPTCMLFIWLTFSAYSEFGRYNDACHQYRQETAKLAKIDGDCKKIQQRINALKNSPKAVERVAREKFGWCREGEEVYSFSSPSQWQ